jgi:hypothetical protein
LNIEELEISNENIESCVLGTKTIEGLKESVENLRKYEG